METTEIEQRARIMYGRMRLFANKQKSVFTDRTEVNISQVD